MEISASVRDRLDAAVKGGVTPGAVLAVVDASGIPQVEVFGRRRFDGDPVSRDTRYDLASLTKSVATLPSILRLVAEGEVLLDDPVRRFFSSAGWFQAPSLGDVTIRQLLTHTSGLPAWKPLYAVVERRRTALAALLNCEVVAPGKIVYSDLGFMLLAAVIERVASERLDTFAKREVFEPLDMHETSFGPVADVPVAATEDCGWRNRVLEGEVHDENATVWDGVAGHAGLFGTGQDLARYAYSWLTSNPALGPAELLAEAVREQASDGVQRRGLGWLLYQPGWFAGASTNGFGHSGFTGTSLCIDHDTGLAVVLLTNRVHPLRGSADGVKALRSDIHAELWGRDSPRNTS